MVNHYAILRSADGSTMTMVDIETPTGRKNLSAMKRSGWTVRGWVETDLTIGALRRGLAYKGKGGRKK